MGQSKTGIRVGRFFSRDGDDPFEVTQWERRSAKISSDDGSDPFTMNDVMFPRGYSQTAVNIIAAKYFRKRGVGGPEGHETSLEQVFRRISITIADAGLNQGIFGDPGDSESVEAAGIFRDELATLMLEQRGLFNSPVLFNLGLFHYHGIKTGSGGNWAWDDTSHAPVQTTDSYSRPASSACFIQHIPDDLISIFEWITDEQRIFRFGGGSGVSLSSLRSENERLSGGGTSSGAMAWAEVADRATGSTKSGGTTRRAAAMRTMDIEHPDAPRFIEWKAAEENKARALVGAGYSVADAVKTVSGQNSNNSIRLSDDFMRAVREDRPWSTRRVVDGSVAATYRAVDLWKKIVRAAWECADPGVHFSTTINTWHTTPAAGPINASNPCSEYLSNDDTACNLSSLNLVKFLVQDQVGETVFDIAGYRHAARVFFIAQEILVDLASYPTRKIAQNAHDYRQIGLGYANLGSLLMRIGLPYDSDEGRRVAAELTAILTGEAYCTSADIASVRGPFSGYQANREAMLRVMWRHRAAADRCKLTRSSLPAANGADAGVVAQFVWERAIELGQQYGYRNAQATVLAPTGTIALAMDCDTTGIEPDFALVRRKELAGGGYIKQTNLALRPSLLGLGYTSNEVDEIITWVVGTGRLSPRGEDGSPVHASWLSDRGLTDADIAAVWTAIDGAMSIEDAVTPVVLGSSAVQRLGLSEYVSGASWRKDFSVLRHWGLTRQQIHSASDIIIGRMTVEGAPHLKPEHLPVFDCANRCGRTGRRFISPSGHVRMLAATQPFLSGAASKTVNLPNDATEQDIADVYMLAWEEGVKCVAVYRDKSKVFQVVGQKSDAAEASADKATTALRAIAARTLPARMADIISAPADEISAIHGIAAEALGMSSVAVDEFRAHAKVAVAARPSLLPRGARRRLPKRRGGFTQESRVGGHKIFVRTGEYPDGTLGEIFLNVSKQGGPLGSMYHAFAVAVSIGLQYGVPPAEFVEAFKFWRFDPQGVVTDHPRIKFSLSIVDFIARMIAVDYLGMNELAHVMPETSSEATSRAGLTTGQKFAMGALEEGASRTAAMAVGGAIDEAMGEEDDREADSEIEHCPNPVCPGLMRRTGKCLTCDACGSASGGCS